MRKVNSEGYTGGKYENYLFSCSLDSIMKTVGYCENGCTVSEARVSDYCSVSKLKNQPL